MRITFFVFAILATAPFSLAQESAYWSGIDHTFAKTAFGNVAAIAAHNCYVDNSANQQDSLARTLKRIHAAQTSGADLIELDVCQIGNDILVSHDDQEDRKTKSAKLVDVLADPKLRSGSQILFVEIKETRPSKSFANALLQIVSESLVANPRRPIVFRAFEDRRQNLVLIREALAKPDFAHLANSVRFHELIQNKSKQSVRQVQSRIVRSFQSGFQGVEFRYDSPNLFAKIGYAKSLGLSVTTYTIPHQFGEVFVAGLREEVDAIVVDYSISKSRKIVTEKTGLIHLNTREIADGATSTLFSSNNVKYRELDLATDNAPEIQNHSIGDSFFGSALKFDGQHSLTFYDADNQNNAGYMISTCVKFDRIKLTDNETQSIFAKSDNGGFFLELHNPSGPAASILRFGVRVGSRYHTASYPVEKLNPNDSFFIIAAYDGDGGVRMWINGSDQGVTVQQTRGGVVKNNSPVVMGADPQGRVNRRSFFKGTIQQVQLQNWQEH